MSVRSTEAGRIRGSKTSLQCTEAGIKVLIGYQPFKGMRCFLNVENRLTNDTASCPRTMESSSTKPWIPKYSSNIYPNRFNKARNWLQYDTLFWVESDFETRLSICLWKWLIQHANRSLNHVQFITQNSWCVCQLQSFSYPLTTQAGREDSPNMAHGSFTYLIQRSLLKIILA